MKKRYLTILCTAALTFAILTGCSGKPQTGNINDENIQKNITENTEDITNTQVTNSGNVSESSAQTPSGIITEKKAKKIALAEVEGAADSDILLHLEYDDGIQVYEGSIVYNEMEYDFEINAETGKIIEWEASSIYD